jgi:hypothetical protein
MGMKLRKLIDPDFDSYRTVGDLARTLKLLLVSAQPYRQTGRWGSFGPHETLIGYSGCVNSLNTCWHSGRYFKAVNSDATTWQENHDFLYRCILGSLCDNIGDEWRKTCGVSLDMELGFNPSYKQEAEKEAWEEFVSLHKYKLAVKSLNPYHRSVNMLAEPQLIIGREKVRLTCNVTQASEIRQSPRCYSRWDVCFLLRENKEKSTAPFWKFRESFPDFIARACEFYKTITEGDVTWQQAVITDTGVGSRKP